MLGSPVVDEDGRLAGIIINPQAGLALPADHLRESMERVVNNRREFSPFEGLGFNIHYSFVTDPKKAGRQFVAEVISVKTNTPAAKSGIVKGDFITEIDGRALDWSVDVASMFSEDLPLPLKLRRDGNEVSLRLTNEDEAPVL